MHFNMIKAIFRKDLLDAIRDSRVLIAILVPLGIGVLYNFMFDDEAAMPEATVAYYAPDETTLPNTIEAIAGETVQLEFTQASDADEVRQLVNDDDADIGLILPAGFDAAVERGQAPQLTILLPESPTFGGDYIAAALEPSLRQMAGQAPPAVIQVDRVVEDVQTTSDAIFEQLGLRSYFVLAAVVMLIAMIGMLAVPVILTEEVEKRTLDALVMIASYLDVISAKALVGLAYIAVSVPLLLIVTGLSPEDPLLFAAATLLFSIVIIGFGLLIGGLFRNANKVNTWSGVIILPIVAPAFIAGLPIPDFLESILNIMPTTHATRLFVNSMSGQDLFPNTALSLAILAVWTIPAYLLLMRSLSRREV